MSLFRRDARELAWIVELQEDNARLRAELVAAHQERNALDLRYRVACRVIARLVRVGMGPQDAVRFIGMTIRKGQP
jgi:hypothetical protein